MGSLINGVPVFEVLIENPLLYRIYPSEGYILAIFDTGYEGFALIPEDIFTELELDKLELHSRELILPDGTLVRSSGIFGKVSIPKHKISKEGFIETVKEVDEVVLGVDFAKGLRFGFDYCSRRVDIRSC